MRIQPFSFVILLLALPVRAQTNPAVNVARWEMHEFSVTARAQVSNPFRDASLVGEFTSPSGKSIVIPGFYDGEIGCFQRKIFI